MSEVPLYRRAAGWGYGGGDAMRPGVEPAYIKPLFFLFTLVKGPRGSLSLKPETLTFLPYRGTSPIRSSAPLGPYSRTMPRALRKPEGEGLFLMSEVPL